MEILMIIIVVIGLIAKANKAKAAQEEARRKREAAARAAAGMPPADPRYPQQTRMPLEPLAPTVQPTVVTRKPDPRFFDTDEEDEAARQAALAKIRQQAALREQEQKRRAQQAQAQRQQQTRQRMVLPDDEPEGLAAPGSLTANVASTVTSTMLQPKGRRHTLEASSVTGHAHAETSMTGLESDADCPTEPADAVRAGNAASYTFGARALSFDRDAVVNGILYAEILGKPKALRRA
ncbi:MAG: hypothetical protein PHO41_09485 [Eubacteriales bacterium]|nr:hypothetical protein [Eubacteriales bacterium]